MGRGARLSEADRRPTVPLRTCVGCRERAERSRLLRVVVSGTHLVPDLRAVLPGRGAWVHPDLVCLDLAARRRAFGRALHAAGPLDDAAVRTHLVHQQHDEHEHDQHGHDQHSPTVEIGSGSASDGHPMSSQR